MKYATAAAILAFTAHTAFAAPAIGHGPVIHTENGQIVARTAIVHEPIEPIETLPPGLLIGRDNDGLIGDTSGIFHPLDNEVEARANSGKGKKPKASAGSGTKPTQAAGGSQSKSTKAAAARRGGVNGGGYINPGEPIGTFQPVIQRGSVNGGGYIPTEPIGTLVPVIQRNVVGGGNLNDPNEPEVGLPEIVC